MSKEPLYPHVAKSREPQFPHKGKSSLITVETILQNKHGVIAIACMPAMADVISGATPKPRHYPEEATQSLAGWLRWFAATPAVKALDRVMDDLGVVHVTRGDIIWHELGFLLPGATPTCGPCQFEYSKLIEAGADGGCLTLVCSVPGENAFCITVGTNVDGTRLLMWPQNIGLGPLSPDHPLDRDGWKSLVGAKRRQR